MTFGRVYPSTMLSVFQKCPESTTSLLFQIIFYSNFLDTEKNIVFIGFALNLQINMED